jgi:hypothetical protein
MRATALFRWGLTCLLLAPLAFLAWALSPGGGERMQPSTPESIRALATGWGIVAPVLSVLLVLTGALLCALAIRRGVRGVERLARGEWTAPTASSAPRVIVPADWESTHPAKAPARRLSRRALGALLAVGLLSWAGVIAWVLLAGHPLSLARGALPLSSVYAAWNPVGRSGFIVAMIVWAALAVCAAAVVAVIGLRERSRFDAMVVPKRFAALAAILASALAIAAAVPYSMLGLSLLTDLAAIVAEPVQTGPSAGSWFVVQGGIAFSAVAILLSVPSWQRAAPSSGGLVIPD